MRRYTLVLFLFLAAASVSAQSSAREAYDAGVADLKANRYGSADKNFTKALKQAPSKEMMKYIFIWRGQARKGLQRYKAAIEDFDQAIRLDTQDPATYVDRAWVYLEMTEVKKAQEDFQGALKISPDGPMAETSLLYLGQIEFHSGNYPGSIEYFDRYVALNDSDPEVYYYRAVAYDNMVDFEAALQDYDRVLALRPDFRDAIADRGVVRLNLTPTDEKDPPPGCLTGPCEDLVKAHRKGDQTIKDLVDIYCDKCK